MYVGLFCSNIKFVVVYPTDYLTRTLKHADDLLSHFVWFKTYPVSEFGLDICNPSERLLIFQAMVAIIEYVSSGKAMIGAWKK